MKITLEGRFTRDLRATLRSHNMRVGILTSRKHIPAASKDDGHKRALGYKARKTQNEVRREIVANRKKLREKIAKARAKARNERAKARSLGADARAIREALGKANSKARERRLERRSQKLRAAAKKLREKARHRTLAAKSAQESQPKLNQLKKTRWSIKQVFVRVQKRSGIDLLRRPFRGRKTQREVRKFSRAYMEAAFKGRSMTKVEKLLVDVVRVPILKRRYGRNHPSVIEDKGFNRRFFDTAQVAENISAKIKKRAPRKSRKKA